MGQEATRGGNASEGHPGHRGCSLPQGLVSRSPRKPAQWGLLLAGQRRLQPCPHTTGARPAPDNPPAQPSSASVSRSSRPLRCSALMMVGRGARSTSCLSGRGGRAVPSLLSLLMRERRGKDAGPMPSTHTEKTQVLFKNQVLDCQGSCLPLTFKSSPLERHTQ